MHILFLDPLEQLVIKKDSTLLLAHALKKAGHEVRLLFPEHFYFQNQGTTSLSTYNFSSELVDDAYYFENFKLTSEEKINLTRSCTIHMRIDPPFDTRYLRYLWMLRAIQKTTGAKIVNSAEGILHNNEKLRAYEINNSALSYVGANRESFFNFLSQLKSDKIENMIFKPLDLYQGIGVKKIPLDQSESELGKLFQEMVEEYSGPVVVQPYLKEVEKGEIRSVFFAGKHIGSILKTPPKGEFLANIAQGATFESYQLKGTLLINLEKVSLELNKEGVPWIAYDILGTQIQEINVTCPGLIVEVSQANKTNLAEEIVSLL